MDMLLIIKRYCLKNNISVTEDDILNKVDIMCEHGVFRIARWELSAVIPSIDELLAFKEEADIIEASLKYIELRKGDYPPIAEQLDMLYHDKINGTSVWLDAIRTIKERYPKQ